MKQKERDEMFLYTLFETYDTKDDLSEDVIDKLYHLQRLCDAKGVNFDRCSRAANCFFDVDKAKINNMRRIGPHIDNSVLIIDVEPENPDK